MATERIRARQPVLRGDSYSVEPDLRLPDRPQRCLALHDPGLVAGGALLYQEPLHRTVRGVPRPHDHDVSDAAVADPLLVPADDVGLPVRAGRGFQRDRVGPVLGLGQRKRADLLQPRHRSQPALLLLLRPALRDRLHRQPSLHSQESAQAAVAPVDLHVDQAGRQRIYRRSPGNGWRPTSTRAMSGSCASCPRALPARSSTAKCRCRRTSSGDREHPRPSG
jgi:hypothetical protein